MSTGNKKVDIFLKKFLPQQQITENFFDYLQKLIADTTYWTFRASGVFVPDVFVTPILSASAPDTIDFATPLIGTDGLLGHIAELDPLQGSLVAFENSLGIVYHTGLRFQSAPQETEVNVRTGKIKYTFLEESIGELADPDLVVDDLDGTLTIRVDSVCEAGVSNAGRKVRVWLKEAVSQAQAFQELTVLWDGFNNYIETTHAIGQQIGSISTDPTKYSVMLIGPTIKRNTDLRLDANVIYTGAVTGAGAGNTPTIFNHVDVNNLSFGIGALSSLFFAEHSNIDGTHTDITPETITTKQSIPGVQLDTRVNASDEDVPDAPAAFTLEPSTGGTGIQGVKWRLRNSSGATIAMIDAHGNAYFQRLEAVASVFQSSIIVEGNSVFGDDINTDVTTLNSVLASLSDLRLLVDSDNNSTGNMLSLYKNSVAALNEFFRVEESGDMRLFGNIYTANPGLNIDLDSDNNDISEILQITKDGGLVTLLQLLADGKVNLTNNLITDLAALSLDLDFGDTLTGESFSIRKNAGAVTLWSLNEFGDAKSFRDTLTQAGLAYTKPSDPLVPVLGVNASLHEVFDQTKSRNLLRSTANSPADKAINIAAGFLTLSSGEKFGIINNKLLVTYAGGSVNFSTGVVTGGGANFTPYTPSAPSRFFKYGLALAADNTIIVLPPTADAATAALAPEPAISGGIPVAIITIQDDGTGGSGTITDIVETAILRFGTGGSGSGSGDANSFLEDLKNRLSDSFWEWATPNIFSLNEQDLIDLASTATFNVADAVYEFGSIADVLLSIQQYDQRFLASDRLNETVELLAKWGIYDDNATYEVSRDGGSNWLTLTPERIAETGKVIATGTFPDPIVLSTIHNYAVANADSTQPFNTSTQQQWAVPFTIAPGVKEHSRQVTLYLNKLGVPTGKLTAKIIRDDSGFPSTDTSDLVCESILVDIATLAAGDTATVVDLISPLPAGTYWIVIAPDSAYQASYSAGVDEIRFRGDSSAPAYGTDSQKFNGTVWSATAGFQGVFLLEGFTYELLTRITNALAGATLEGYGIFYGESGPGVVVGAEAIEHKQFDGGVDTFTFTLTNFLPEPEKLKIYHVNTGRVYRYPAFTLQGHDISFPPGTFLDPGNQQILIFDQSEGGGFDNSDRNAALLAANGLGSTDATIDASAPGVGVKLRSLDGQLWHVTVTNAGAILTTAI